MNASIAATAPAGETKTLSLVSVGHGFSHLYMLALPPLFPFIKDDFDVSWTALGIVVALYSVGSGVAQIGAGLAVDRYGARRLLLSGFVVQAVAIGLIGIFPSIWVMGALMLVAGLGNSVFHPADYSILNARIQKERMGRAFSVHLFASFIGWMAAPILMLFLAKLYGWQAALAIAGAIGMVFFIALYLGRDSLDDHGSHLAGAPTKTAGGTRDRMRLMLSPAILLFLVFTTLISIAGSGLQTFVVVSLVSLHGITVDAANVALSIFFFVGGLGVFFGGWLADKTRRHEHVTLISFLVSSLAIAVLAVPELSSVTLIVFLAIGGFTSSIVSPVRDVMIRAISPAGSVATVFGIVTSGFAIGAAIAPPIFGWMNDLGRPELLFLANGVIMMLSVVAIYAARTARV